FSVCDGDCDDGRSAAYPGAPETCNGLDDDCDGFPETGADALCDDADPCTTDRCGGLSGCQYPIRDLDGDSYPDLLCGGSDCNDANPAVHPFAPEQCNGADEDCDGVMDEGGDLLCNDQEICPTDFCDELASWRH